MGGYLAYAEYKDSEVEGLGEIPSHWEIWKATHGFNKIGSGTTPKSDKSLYYEGDIPWITTAELRESVIYRTSQQLTKLALKDNPTLNYYKAGSLAIAMYGATIGRLGILGVDATVNQACCVFSDPTVFDTKFFYYWLWMRRPILVSLSNGGGQPNLNQDTLKQLKIPIPTVSEQQQIATFLDYKTSQIDALIAKKEALLEKLAEKRTALISQAVTKGLDASVDMKDSGVEWLGEIPAHWKTPPLYARYSVELGKMLHTGRITGEHLVPYLRNVDVQWNSINQNDLPKMDIRLDEYQRYLVKAGDLLVCEGGESGRSAIVPKLNGSLGFQKALHRLRPLTKDESPNFLLYVVLWATTLGVFLADGNPNTIPHLTGEKLKLYRFPKPPLAEQTAITNFLGRQSSQIEYQSNQVEKAIDKLKEYRTALITNAVTGKIDVRNIKLPQPIPSEAT